MMIGAGRRPSFSAIGLYCVNKTHYGSNILLLLNSLSPSTWLHYSVLVIPFSFSSVHLDLCLAFPLLIPVTGYFLEGEMPLWILHELKELEIQF